MNVLLESPYPPPHHERADTHVGRATSPFPRYPAVALIYIHRFRPIFLLPHPSRSIYICGFCVPSERILVEVGSDPYILRQS